jgi:hypothetical protein
MMKTHSGVRTATAQVSAITTEFTGVQMGSTEFQHDTTSSVFCNTTKDVPDLLLESNEIVEEYRKK